MQRGVEPGAFEEVQQRSPGKRAALRGPGKHQGIARRGEERARLVEDRHRAFAQRNPVRALRLHPPHRYRPGPSVDVDLVPARAPCLARARGGQDHELEGQAREGTSRSGVHGGDRLADLDVRHRAMVLGTMHLRAERGGDGALRGRVVGTVALPDRPLKHGADALAGGVGAGRYRVPDRAEHPHHVGSCDPRHLDGTERTGVTLERGAKLTGHGVSILPGGSADRDHLLDRAYERRHPGLLRRLVRTVALRGERVPAFVAQAPVGERRFAGLGERDPRPGAEADPHAPALSGGGVRHHELLHPALRPGWGDVQVQSVRAESVEELAPVLRVFGSGGAHPDLGQSRACRFGHAVSST